MRTVSLFPSATELVAGIGAMDDLVGRSHQCNHPPEVLDIPAVTESKLSERAGADARAIDSVVDDHHHGEDTYFRVITERLESVRPSVLITQSLCDVCAVPESMTVESMEALDQRPELVTLGPTTIDGILEAIEQIGRALGRETAADRLIDGLEDRIDSVVGRCPEPANPPRVVCLEWTDALRCHGLWVSEILDRLGVDDGFGYPGEHGRVIDWADVRAFDPEVLIVSPCGRTIPEINTDMAHLIDRSGWSELSAVRNDRVYLLNGEISSRHGPRVVRTLELIAEIVYPDTYTDITPLPEEVDRFESSAVTDSYV